MKQSGKGEAQRPSAGHRSGEAEHGDVRELTDVQAGVGKGTAALEDDALQVQAGVLQQAVQFRLSDRTRTPHPRWAPLQVEGGYGSEVWKDGREYWTGVVHPEPPQFGCSSQGRAQACHVALQQAFDRYNFDGGDVGTRLDQFSDDQYELQICNVVRWIAVCVDRAAQRPTERASTDEKAADHRFVMRRLFEVRYETLCVVGRVQLDVFEKHRG